MKKICFLFVMSIILSSGYLFSKSVTPKTFLIPGEKLLSLRDNFINGTILSNPAFKRLLRDANKMLKQDIPTVTSKTQTPPSGDKHDYTSFGVYWWPDESKPDGLPYIQKDGVKNPKVKEFTDKIYLNSFITSIHTLSLAYFITQDSKYAHHAATLLKKWFIDQETKMNPNLNYAGYIPGKTEGGRSGLIDTHRFPQLVDGIVLLQESTELSGNDKKEIDMWMSDYLQWLIESKNGSGEAKARNNHGTWYDVQFTSIALYLGKNELARKTVEDAKLKRITAQIEPDGKQTFELLRTNSWGYSNFNLTAFFNLAILAEHVNVDLWNYENEGKSIRKALDFLLPFSNNTSAWKTKQISEFSNKDLFSILLIAEKKFASPQYVEWRKKLFGDEMISDKANLFYNN